MDAEEKGRYYTQGVSVPKTPPAGQPPEPWGKTHFIGKPMTRVDAYERVSGAAVYPSDVVLPGMLYAAVVRCPHAHARVTEVRTGRAEKMDGVYAVLSPWDREAEIPWSYSGFAGVKKESRLLDPVCRHEGEAVAAVAADTPYRAADAARAVEVDYEVLPFIADPYRADRPGAAAVHEPGNLVSSDRYERGDLQKGLAQAHAVVEETFRTPCELHTPLELHGCVAAWEGERLTIWESTQGVFAVQELVAKALDMPLSKVRVKGRYVGGGFGSKLVGGKYTILAALLAKKTGRPVKLFLSREDTFRCVGNRPPTLIRVKAGATEDGRLTALEFEATGTGGAYPSDGTGLLDFQVRDLYACENVLCATRDVYINAGPARPFRAPGHPQCSFALEQALDALARRIGMDPVAFRLKNIPEKSLAREGAPPYTTTGLRDCLEQGAKHFGWEAAKEDARKGRDHSPVKRGVGMAACSWFVGGGWPPSTVIVKLFSDGSVNLNFGASDIGTGTKTVLAMTAAEELGVSPDVITIEHADTETTQYASPSGGSKTVPTEAPAVRAACVEVKRALLEMGAKVLNVEMEDLVLKDGAVAASDAPEKRVLIRELPDLQSRGVAVGVGYRGPNPPDKAIVPFCAQFCEVAVDTRTGEVKILRFLSANDSGRVMNRLTYDNQVVGGITMGVGLAMTEERILDRRSFGTMVNANWHDYKLPTMLDAPLSVNSHPIDRSDDTANSTGALGLGEPVTIPTAAAVANAVADALGQRLFEAPMTPDRVLSALSGGERKV